MLQRKVLALRRRSPCEVVRIAQVQQTELDTRREQHDRHDYYAAYWLGAPPGVHQTHSDVPRKAPLLTVLVV